VNNGSERAPDCLDAETLAAFLDGRLDAEARARAEAHLAECQECYEAFVETVKLRSETSAQVGMTPEVRAIGMGRTGRIGWYVGVLAVAATIAGILLLNPTWLARWRSDRPELVELVAAVGARRPIEARLTGGFSWGAVPSVVRGDPSIVSATPEVQIAVAHIDQELRTKRTSENLRAYAAAHLALGESAESIGALADAARSDSRNAGLWSDLAAAYLTRAAQSGDQADIELAEEAAHRALAIDARLLEARFNLGLALEGLGRNAEALAAWQEYVSQDQRSAWGQEAGTHLKRLSKGS
jgi:tetratricopeptide (TPR) repeat protein